MITDARACKTKSGDLNACRICREKVKLILNRNVRVVTLYMISDFNHAEDEKFSSRRQRFDSIYGLLDHQL